MIEKLRLLSLPIRILHALDWWLGIFQMNCPLSGTWSATWSQVAPPSAENEMSTFPGGAADFQVMTCELPTAQDSSPVGDMMVVEAAWQNVALKSSSNKIRQSQSKTERQIISAPRQASTAWPVVFPLMHSPFIRDTVFYEVVSRVFRTFVEPWA